MSEEREIIKGIDKVLEEIINETEKVMSSTSNWLNQRVYFLQGIALGLFYGIVGNIFVSHYYQVFEGLTLGKFDVLFWTNLVVFVIALVLILLVSVIFYYQLRKYKSGMSELSELQKELYEIKTFRTIEEMQKKINAYIIKKSQSQK